MATCKDCERWHQKFYCFCGDAFGNERNDVERVCKDFKKIEGNIMNREILFRGKRFDNGEWIEGDLIHRKIWWKEIAVIRVSDDGFDKYDEYEVIPETVGQYTGLTDKNGKMIFEGDIVSDTVDVYTVVFDEQCRFMMTGEYDRFLVHCDEDCFVLGNVFDDPELLEVGK